MAISRQQEVGARGPVQPEGVSSTYARESLSTILAEMLAKMRRVEPTQEGFRLYEFLDPEALDALYEHAQHHDQATWQLEIQACEETVRVRSDGVIRISRKD